METPTNRGPKLDPHKWIVNLLAAFGLAVLALAATELGMDDLAHRIKGSRRAWNGLISAISRPLEADQSHKLGVQPLDTKVEPNEMKEPQATAETAPKRASKPAAPKAKQPRKTEAPTKPIELKPQDRNCIVLPPAGEKSATFPHH